jgi:phosphoserine phosphatase
MFGQSFPVWRVSIYSHQVLKPVQLAAFDFDGTLSNSEMIVLLGRRVGAEAEMADITARAMNGELNYADSLRSRVALLEGLPVDEVDEALQSVSLRPDAPLVLSALNNASVRTIILTGGFERGVRRALERAHVTVDRVVANRLPSDGGVLTGSVEGPLIDTPKDEVLREVANEYDVPLVDIVAVGDGANDRSMLETVGIAIGYDPKPAIEDVLDESATSMTELLEILRHYDVL